MKKHLVWTLAILALTTVACDPGGGGKTTNNSNQLPNPCGDVGGAPHEYIISDIYVPESLAEGVGRDFDGNGSIDNKLSSMMSLLLSESREFAINDSLDEGIANGSVIVLGRVMTQSFTGDPDVSVSIFRGEYTGVYTADILSGTGTFTWDPEEPNVGTLCGRIYGAGITQAGPGDITLSLPVNENMQLSLVLHHARLEGITSEEGWTDMVLSGAVLPEDLKDTIIPNYVDNVNADIAADPQGSQFILDTFDDRCSTELAGCAGNPDCASDGVITEAELRCNSIINTILTPDVTVGGVQYVSFGIRLQAVPADITNL